MTGYPPSYPLPDISDRIPLTDAQRKKIWALARAELRWDASRLHEYLDAIVGKKHVRSLTRVEGRKVIDRLERLAGRQPNQGYRDRGVAVDETGELQELATPAEAAKIRALAERVGEDEDWACRIATGVFERSIASLSDLHAPEIHLLLNIVADMVATIEQRRRQGTLFKEVTK